MTRNIHNDLSSVPARFFAEMERVSSTEVYFGTHAEAYLGKAIFNAEIKPRAVGVVKCHDEGNIRKAVQVAANHGIPVSVLAGGHDFSGRAFDGRSLVLDIRPLAGASLNPARSEVLVQGGSLALELFSALPGNLVTVTGTARSVGIAGFTFGGGYGKLNSRFGMGADCLQFARVVLANGEVVIASEEDNPDLLWALRGGGSGFGVVTSLSMKVHRMEESLNATIVFNLDHAKKALLFAQELIDLHPVDLSLHCGLITLPNQGPMLFMAPLWSGNPLVGEQLIRDFETKFEGYLVNSGWMAYKDTFNDEAEEKSHPKGFHYNLRTQIVSRLNDAVLDVLIDSAKRFTSPFSAILLHDFHGAASSIKPESTAFRLREEHYLIEVISAWSPDQMEHAAIHKAWREQVCEDLDPLSMTGGYASLASPSESDRVRLFYGDSAELLLRVKSRVDPDDLFRSGIGRLTSSQNSNGPMSTERS